MWRVAIFLAIGRACASKSIRLVEIEIVDHISQ
jgi:hypothetical protein